MKQGSNKFLIGIVIGIILLVSLRRPAPEYQAEDTPEGITHNYLLALQEANYQRAFGYLSPTLEHPADLETFVEDIEDSAWEFQLNQNASLAIESSEMTSGSRATVSVRSTVFNNGGLFSGNPNSRSFKMRLENQDGQWELVDGDLYWSYCWGSGDNCDENLRRVP